LVVGRRFAGAFFNAGFFADPADGFARVPDFAAGAFFFAAGCLPVVAAAPDDTRDECLARCLVFFGAAASAIEEDSANAASRATTSIFMELRIMRLR
jgi:hypothetical protein